MMSSERGASDQYFELARKFQARAYAPYSSFNVGALIVTSEGHTFGGCNVENASYGMTICAERSAAASAVSAGYRDFKDLYLVGPPGAVITPCGACRQFLSEFNAALLVHMDGPSGVRTATLGELLPGAFGPSDLQ